MDGGLKPIKDGDIVLVDPDHTPLPGDLVVVVTEGRQMLKQLGQKIDESIELKSFNKEHPTLYMNMNNVEKVLRVVFQQKKGIKW